MHHFVRIILELLPLQVLAVSLSFIDPSQPQSWMTSYYIAAVAAAGTLFVLIRRQATPDPVVWGINAYLLVSAALLGGGTYGFPALLMDMKAAGILGAVTLVSLFTFGTRPEWLLATTRKVPDKLALLQLVLTAGCFGLAFVYRNESVAASLLPLCFLFLVRRILREQVEA